MTRVLLTLSITFIWCVVTVCLLIFGPWIGGASPFMLGAVLLIAGLGGAAGYLYAAARKKTVASFVAANTMEFVVAQGTPIRVLENIKDWYFEPRRGWFDLTDGRFTPLQKGEAPDHAKILEEAGKSKVLVKEAIVRGDPAYVHPIHRHPREYLRRRFGFFWVSILYPLRSIHRFKITKVRLAGASDPTASQKHLRDWLSGEKTPVEVDNLRWVFPRPILIEDLEFKDRLHANLGIVVNIQVVMPYIPVFKYPGEFFSNLESQVRSRIVDFARQIDLAEFISQRQSGISSSFYKEHVLPMNLDNAERSSVIRKYGLWIVDAWVAGIEPTGEAVKALQQMQLAILKGDADIAAAERSAKAVVTRADGDAKAIRAVGEAKAAALQSQVAAVGKEVVIAQNLTERIAALKGTGLRTLVEGGASASVLLQDGGDGDKKEPRDGNGGAPEGEGEPRAPDTEKEPRKKQGKAQGNDGGKAPQNPKQSAESKS